MAGAEEAFERAYELGWTLQPGLALLRLAQGQVEAATSVASQALAAESDPLRRTWLLPAQVEIAIAAGNLESARSAASELEAMAETFGTPGLRASAACARGAVQLADGDAPEAVDSLRAGWRLWQEVEAPYEAAKARMLLAAAHRTQGDGESARLELRAARSAFERLGAEPDVRRTSELLEEVEVARTPAPSPGVTRTFMFTDIVRSTDLVEAIGDEAWADLLRWHDDTLSRLFAAHGGEEVKQVGDGFFVAFEGSGLAIDCAMAIQRTLTEHRREHGFALQVRIGLHAADATRNGRDYRGRGVHTAARIAELAGAGEILASGETVEGQANLGLSEPRMVRLKGISIPVDVVTIHWREAAR